MKKLVAIAVLAALIGAAGITAMGEGVIGSKTTQTITRYVAMKIGGRDINGQRIDHQFFLGRLPRVGEPVDLVFTGRDASTGDLHFQLRVRQ